MFSLTTTFSIATTNLYTVDLQFVMINELLTRTIWQHKEIL